MLSTLSDLAMTIDIFTKDMSWNLLYRIAIKCDVSVNLSINQSKIRTRKIWSNNSFLLGELLQDKFSLVQKRLSPENLFEAQAKRERKSISVIQYPSRQKFKLEKQPVKCNKL